MGSARTSHSKPRGDGSSAAARLKRPRVGERPPGPPADPVPLSHPAAWLALLATTLAIAAIVTHKILDPDLWQHLRVGRTIWELKRVPATHLWTWPTYGQPEVLPSWLFRVLVWPVWNAGGAWGLQVWRWLTTLGAFALAWATARRLGARGFAPLLVLVLGALVWRQRSQVRPETFAALLLMGQLFVLELKRHGGRDLRAALPVFALLWVNAHISWWMGIALTSVFLADAWLRRRDPAAAADARALAMWLAASVVVLLFNPFGWKAIAQPFEYQLSLKDDPLFRSIAELQPVDWSVNVANGLPLFLLLCAGAAIARATRRGVDRVEWALLLLFGWLGLGAQRFLGFFALLATPYLMRDLAETLAAWRVPAPAAWPRAALVALTASAMIVPELSRRDVPIGVGIVDRLVPVGACDYVERAGVRGRVLNTFWEGGYLLWRFWPERDRLPFMDIHQSGTPRDRALIAAAGSDAAAFAVLDQERHFDWVLWPRLTETTTPLGTQLDADRRWALVFLDDAALLYVRRDGPLAAIAARDAYHVLPSSDAELAAVANRAMSDTTLMAGLRAELDREVRESPRHNATPRSQRATLALFQGRWAASLADLDTVAAMHSLVPFVQERRGEALLRLGRAREAVAAFEAHKRETPER